MDLLGGRCLLKRFRVMNILATTLIWAAFKKITQSFPTNRSNPVGHFLLHLSIVNGQTCLL